MKRNISIPALIGLLSLLMFRPSIGATNHPNISSRRQDTAVADSAISVISYFCKRDTFIYRINESSWKFKGADTVLHSSVSSRVMLTVTDSTPKGYDMEYTFLDFQADTSITSFEGRLGSLFVESFGEEIAGTTIKFRTDECGIILGYENLGEIKKQAKRLYKEALRKMGELPEMKVLKENKVDMGKIMSQYIDADALVKGYVEELELLFTAHGKQYSIGKSEEHQDATEEEYASDTYRNIFFDPETEEYGLIVDINEYIPRAELKALTREVITALGVEKLVENMDSAYDRQVKEDGVRNSYFYIRYFANGWPQEVTEQSGMHLMGQGKLKQKHITWEYYSTGNF